MLQKLKHWLIPHAGNGHKPHIIRPKGYMVVGLLIAGSMFLSNLANGQPAVLGYATNISASSLTSLTNSARSDNGLATLTTNAKLIQAANAKAQDMIAKDYWAHTSPSGKQPWDFINEAGYNYIHAGENLAYGFSTSSGVHTGWMNSSGHRANILNSDYKEIGIAVVDAENFQGGENTIVVAMYGARTESSPAPAPTPEPEPTPTTTTEPSPAPADTAQPEPEPEPQQPEEQPQEEPEGTNDDESPESTAAQPVQSSGPPAPDNQAALPSQTEYGLLNPLSITTLGWSAAIGAMASGTMFFSSSLRHIHFWKHHKPRSVVHWLHKHPVLESMMLGVITALILTNGFGVVG